MTASDNIWHFCYSLNPWIMGHDILYFLNFCQGCTYIRLIITLKTTCTWYHWKYNFETGNLLVFIYYPETFFCDWKPIETLCKPYSARSRTKIFFHHVFFSDWRHCVTSSRSSIVLFAMHLFQSWAINFNY